MVECGVGTVIHSQRPFVFCAAVVPQVPYWQIRIAGMAHLVPSGMAPISVVPGQGEPSSGRATPMLCPSRDNSITDFRHI
jgi:hypothetical protein